MNVQLPESVRNSLKYVALAVSVFFLAVLFNYRPKEQTKKEPSSKQQTSVGDLILPPAHAQQPQPTGPLSVADIEVAA